MQKGPFWYKCVWQGGIRYRDYPKHDAKTKEVIVKHNDVVKVDGKLGFVFVCVFACLLLIS